MPKKHILERDAKNKCAVTPFLHHTRGRSVVTSKVPWFGLGNFGTDFSHSGTPKGGVPHKVKCGWPNYYFFGGKFSKFVLQIGLHVIQFSKLLYLKLKHRNHSPQLLELFRVVLSFPTISAKKALPSTPLSTSIPKWQEHYCEVSLDVYGVHRRTWQDSARHRRYR